MVRTRGRQHPALLFLLVAGDVLALAAAHELSGVVRLALNKVLSRDFTPLLTEQLFPGMAQVLPLWLLTFALVGAYEVLGKRGLRSIFLETAKAASLAMALQIVALFFFTRATYSRSLFLLYWALVLVLVTTARAGALWVARHLTARGLAGERVAVVGTGDEARSVAERLSRHAEARYRFLGFVAPERSTVEALPEGPILCGLDKVEATVNEHGIERLVVAEPDLTRDELTMLAELGTRMQLVLERLPDPLGLVSARPMVSDLDGLPLMTFTPLRWTRRDEILKRLLDLVVGSLSALAVAPLGLLLAAAIKLDSPGPVLFLQRRVGRGGKHFDMYKFRSMHVDAEQRRDELGRMNEAGGHIFKLKGDPRVTRVGRLLRRFSLDELPQLINVLKGEMSLVGPRPLPTGDVPEDLETTPHKLWLELRRNVAPGVTGLWQVSGRSNLPFEEMVRLDLYYVENWSLMLDGQVLLRTLPVIITGRGAY